MATKTPASSPSTSVKQLRFAFPFRKKSQGAAAASTDFTNEHEVHRLLKREPLGGYAVSNKGMWHGGIHVTEAGGGQSLDLKHGVRCIADGEVVAWRLNRTYPVSEIPAQDGKPAIHAPYSTGFALVRHTIEFPKDTKLTFFSLYMHLQDLAGYEGDRTLHKPGYWSPDFKVTGFAKDKPRASAGQMAPAQQAGLRVRVSHPHGAPLCILPQGTQISLSKREGDWGKIRDAHGAQLIPPKTGGYVAPSAATDGWVFLGNENGGRVVEEMMPESSLDRVVLPSTPIPIKAGELIGHLGRYDSLGQQTSNRMVHIEVFCGDDIKSFIDNGRTWISANGANASAWKKLGLPADPTILRIDRKTTLYKAVNQPGQNAPETDVIQVAALAELAKHRGNQHTETTAGTDGMKLRWWKVDSADVLRHDITGWVREQNFAGGRVTREFPQKWVDFETFDNPHDQTHTIFADAKAFVDYSMGADVPERGALGKLSPLMGKVYRALYPIGDQSRAADELSSAAGDPWTALRMSRLIIKHESEWAIPSKWKQLAMEIERQTGPKAHHMAEQKRIEKLVWWDDVKAGVDSLPGSNVFHIHPIGFVGNFAAGFCIPLDKAKELALTITSGFEGSTAMDFGAVAGNGDGQGMSVGVIQWAAGQGTLGPLLERMRSSDEITFRECFEINSNYHALESAISGGDTQALVDWAIDQQAHNPNWKKPFRSLGDVKAFQEIQIDEATEGYHQGVMQCVEFLRSISSDLMRNVELVTYCALYDLAVQQGSLKKAAQKIRDRVSTDLPATQHALVRIAVEERAKTATNASVADCFSRRIGILQQATFTYSAHGHTKSRANANFPLITTDASNYVCGI